MQIGGTEKKQGKPWQPVRLRLKLGRVKRSQRGGEMGKKIKKEKKPKKVVQKAVIKAMELSWGADALALNPMRKEAPKKK